MSLIEFDLLDDVIDKIIQKYLKVRPLVLMVWYMIWLWTVLTVQTSVYLLMITVTLNLFSVVLAKVALKNPVTLPVKLYYKIKKKDKFNRYLYCVLFVYWVRKTSKEIEISILNFLDWHNKLFYYFLNRIILRNCWKLLYFFFSLLFIHHSLAWWVLYNFYLIYSIIYHR